MSMIGYLLAAVGLYALYTDGIILGCTLFFIGGLIAGKLFFCLRSLGVIIIAASVTYGHHNGFTPEVWLCLAVGIILATFNRNRSSRNNDDDNGWGIDLDFSSSGSDGGSCGGDSGGGGD
ncbi:hypothetical protein ACMXYR_10775 [Neptuniibacter sp. QD29_5]|uniref:hypothetical protein n=1 Tax=Neptuniibacter sp. QD29_5 TaxID=3398207 RepID=UPI0039F49B0E